MIRVVAVPSWTLTDELWEAAEDLLKQAVFRNAGLETTADLRDFIMERTVQLWLVYIGETLTTAATTEIVEYRNAKICRWRDLGGRMDKAIFEAMRDVVRPWAKQHNCERWEVIGRPGWEKLARYLIPDVKKVAFIMHGEI